MVKIMPTGAGEEIHIWVKQMVLRRSKIARIDFIRRVETEGSFRNLNVVSHTVWVLAISRRK